MTFNIENKIYVQYQNATKFKNLLQGLASNQYMEFNNSTLLDFANNYLDIALAGKEGLAIWGTILDRNRYVANGEGYDNIFGFGDEIIHTSDTEYPQNFDNGTFYDPQYNDTIELKDPEYRAILLLTYAKYTTNNSAYDLNRIIQFYETFRGKRGTPYVKFDTPQHVLYRFPYILDDWEYVLFQDQDLKFLPRPLGFSVTALADNI